MVSPLLAAKAYAAVQDSAGLGQADKSKAAPGANFGEMVQNAINDTIAQSKGAEVQMGNQIQGKGSLIDVATSISSAQASLETVMAVRDQVISAYQEIMRMSI
ncbi:MAG TPA: flagellar hook-basal body complex protein FliE [Caulobacteraceae bacterium]|jgi:flagellar hook-basal body complex protein FliE